MDFSAFPYFYAVLVDLGLLIVVGYVQHKQRRKVLGFALAFIVADFLRNLLILITAGKAPAISRASIVWLVWGFVVVEHTIMGFGIVAFWKENTTRGKLPATVPAQPSPTEKTLDAA